MKKKFDPTLYLVTGPINFSNRQYCKIINEAVDGGVTMVQLRIKNASLFDFKSVAYTLKAILKHRNIPVIINDYPDIAKEIGADGVHIGQSDCSIHTARKIIGSKAILGLSIESAANLEKIDLKEIDYIAASPVFYTKTKTNIALPLGLVGVQKLREFTNLPLVAIGGLNHKNIPSVLNAGADGIALISEIWNSDFPYHSSKLLKSIILKTRNNLYDTK